MQGEHVGLRWRPIKAEPALAYLPGIIGIATVWAHRVIAIEILRIDPEVRVLTQLATVAHAAKAAFLGATPAVSNPPCVSLARLAIMLMTPLTALAPYSVAPGPRMTSMRSISSSRVSC